MAEQLLALGSTVLHVTDEELREAILQYLKSIRTMGADGTPLEVSDVNLAETLDCRFDQLNRVLGGLIEDGLVHGKPRGLRVSEAEMEWDVVRLADDPLPDPDPHELD